MKPAARLLVSLAAVVMAASGCNYIKPIMYIDVANRSGEAMRNLEVKHPTGMFGLAELRDGQTHRYMAPIGAPCKFKLDFEDRAGRKYSGDYDFGAKCPLEIALEVGPGLKVSPRQVRQ
jgi:hypothetical protein